MRPNLLVAAFILSLIGPATAQQYPPGMSEHAKQAFTGKYLSATANKAFAITPDRRQLFSVSGLPTPGRAARTASLRCLMSHGVPCLIWIVNDQVLLATYEAAAQGSSTAVAALPADIGVKPFAEEDRDVGAAPPVGLMDMARIDSATPLGAPSGARQISTSQLVRLYKEAPGLLLVDALLPDVAKKTTLPRALWLSGAGVSDTEKNGLIDSNLEKAMAHLAPDKTTPIAVYCLNWHCWLSWNASARLVQLGYLHVYWYRGGIDAWQAARLPTVETPITAQLW